MDDAPTDAGETTPAPAARPGRPRRYDATHERRLLLDSAFEILERRGYRDLTVADILGEAGLSTRSFYRHFGSKDELLCAVYRRDAEQFSAALDRRVDVATDPRHGLEIWFDEILGFGTGRPRARRAAVLSGALHAGATGMDVELQWARGALVRPLERMLRAGVETGDFPTAEPEADARTISAIAWDTSGQLAGAGSQLRRDELRAEAIAFCLRALGARS